MTIRADVARPAIPYEGFPLKPHSSGMWSYNFKGRRYYFGPWCGVDGKSRWKEALDQYLVERDELHAGRTPIRRAGNITTLADLLNSFRRTKKNQLDSERLTQDSFDKIEEVCDLIATLGVGRPAMSISKHELEELRVLLCTGKQGQMLGPKSQCRKLSIARSVFNYGNEEFNDVAVKYKKALQGPTALELRRARNEVGERLFTPDEINSLIKIASPQMQAMIYLGINCAFGNNDCARLKVESFDFTTGWHRLARHKTEIQRRAPLWPETLAALYRVVQTRTSGMVFGTKQGNSWEGKGKADPISAEFTKLTKKLGIHRTNVTTFYTLRRTFATIAEEVVSRDVVEFIMGHATRADDMAAIYRQRVSNGAITKAADHVRTWLLGGS